MSLTPSTVRTDLKCGKGSISQGEKCHKGTAAGTALKVAAGAALLGATAYGLSKTPVVQRARKEGLAFTLKRIKHAPGNAIGRARLNKIRNAPLPTANTVREMTGMGPRHKFADPWAETIAPPPVPKALARFAKRRDSIWAEGFHP